jgi:hypothetical protein
MPFGKKNAQGGGRGAGGAGLRGGGRGMDGGGRMGGTRAGESPGGNCLCPGCGAKAPHTPGVPCFTVKCPECGLTMTRE